MTPRLDLHGVRHADVRRMCDSFMSKIWGSCEHADIITGNSDQMKREVMNSLRDYDVEVTVAMENSAVLRVYM